MSEELRERKTAVTRRKNVSSGLLESEKDEAAEAGFNLDWSPGAAIHPWYGNHLSTGHKRDPPQSLDNSQRIPTTYLVCKRHVCVRKRRPEQNVGW